ncbi:MAG: hypothetical protein J6O61_03305 [Butyrivibrio sp.]|uniref:hypothetical protein n=1 Tax=Butyrivibrio sp. TaxID=28121 RepID=UPI001B0D21EA|nr:hypothetical protein [Butyrivibrio sp.]MBO6239855.1 hypothetical protein [Butyrivibrio sp.]
MRCNNCKQILNDKISGKLNFCPICGNKLFDDDKQFLIRVFSVGQRENLPGNMLVFVDERILYEAKPGNGVLFSINGGFHTFKFRCGVRSKVIQILIDSDFEVKSYYNTLTGLIETGFAPVEGTSNGHTSQEIDAEELSQPIMVSETGEKGFRMLLGEDEPDYDIVATSGLLEGKLKIYGDRIEFSPDNMNKPDITDYINIVSVRRKMGAVDVQCEGNVHKIYSIPKDIYNEVMVYLTNRIDSIKG